MADNSQGCGDWGGRGEQGGGGYVMDTLSNKVEGRRGEACERNREIRIRLLLSWGVGGVRAGS